jgi:hypothetical protein
VSSTRLAFHPFFKSLAELFDKKDSPIVTHPFCAPLDLTQKKLAPHLSNPLRQKFIFVRKSIAQNKF